VFDIGFSEILVIAVVALIVIGPERMPKVARTAGHLYGRLQRYVSNVKSDISREVEFDELRRSGQQLKDTFTTATQSVEQQATMVDDFLRTEVSQVDKVVAAMALTEGDRPVIEAARRQIQTEQSPQQSLLLDEPDQNRPDQSRLAQSNPEPGRAPDKTS